MKVIVEFNLPDDEFNMRMALQAVAMRAAIGEFQTRLRNHIKYSDELVTADVVQDWFYEAFEGVDLEY